MKDSEINQLYNQTRFEYTKLAEANDLAMHYIMSNEEGEEDPDLTYRTYFNAISTNENDRVLDVGCGVGGNAIWIAENIGANVTAIDLNEGNLSQAKDFAEQNNVKSDIEFIKMNFHNLDFPDNRFDKIVAVESICHSSEPVKFLKEAYRVLKPGGKLLIADGFLSKGDLTEKEENLKQIVEQGWAVPSLDQKDEFEEEIQEAGFENISFKDNTDRMKTFVNGLYKYNLLFYPFMKGLEILGIKSEWSVKQTKTNIKQKHLVDKEIMIHGYFKCRKPE